MGKKSAITKNLYIIFQPGIAHAMWMQNKWPEFKDNTTMDFINSMIFVPQIQIGWTFKTQQNNTDELRENIIIFHL